jgi:hypothetical protein
MPEFQFLPTAEKQNYLRHNVRLQVELARTRLAQDLLRLWGDDAGSVEARLLSSAKEFEGVLSQMEDL